MSVWFHHAKGYHAPALVLMLEPLRGDEALYIYKADHTIQAISYQPILV
jgi:hypothetical protein